MLLLPVVVWFLSGRTERSERDRVRSSGAGMSEPALELLAEADAAPATEARQPAPPGPEVDPVPALAAEPRALCRLRIVALVLDEESEQPIPDAEVLFAGEGIATGDTRGRVDRELVVREDAPAEIVRRIDAAYRARSRRRRR